MVMSSSGCSESHILHQCVWGGCGEGGRSEGGKECGRDFSQMGNDRPCLNITGNCFVDKMNQDVL